MRYNETVKQVIVVKLAPTLEQHSALVATLKAFNEGCQHVANEAYARRLPNKIDMQPFVYRTLRADYGLSSQMAIRAISKAIEAYKRDSSICPQFRLDGAMTYDERILSFKGLDTVSVLTLSGRILVPIKYGAYQVARIGSRKGQADLVLRDGTFYLHVTIEHPDPPTINSEDVLGVDFGIVQLAVDSDGEAHSGAGIKAYRRRMQRIRQGLQSCGSKNAKRHLQRIKRKESRYQRWFTRFWKLIWYNNINNYSKRVYTYECSPILDSQRRTVST